MRVESEIVLKTVFCENLPQTVFNSNSGETLFDRFSQSFRSLLPVTYLLTEFDFRTVKY